MACVMDLGHSFFAKETPSEAIQFAHRRGRLTSVEVNDNWREWDDDMTVGSVHLIETLELSVQGDLQPDLTLLLDADPEIGMRRALQRGEADRFETEKLAFFDKIRAAYLQRAAAHPERIVVIDAAKPLSAVQADISKHINNKL